MKIFLAFIFLSLTQVTHAAINENRDAVGKSSFTDVSSVYTALSTAPSFVRSVTLSGVDPCTVTVYNAQLFTANVTTANKVYWPGNVVNPITVNFSGTNSSGTLTHKIGVCNCIYNWDWLVKPGYRNPLNERN